MALGPAPVVCPIRNISKTANTINAEIANRLLQTNMAAPPGVSHLRSVPRYARITPVFRKGHCTKASSQTQGVQVPRGCMFSKWPVVSVIAFIVLFGVPHAGAVQIAEPSTGAVVRPGTPVKVKVTIPPGLPVRKVTYTLMEEDRALEDKVESPLSISTAAPPFDVDMAIPADSAGAMRVVAVAEVAERRASYVLFDEVSFRVVPEAPLVALRVESPIRFSGSLGEVKLFNVQGLYGDRVVRDIGSATAGTTYQSRNEKIARTNPDGRVQAVGNGIAEIGVKNETKEDRIRAVVEADETNNQPPVAHAGSNITVRQGTRVRLDGIQSADPEGENLFFYWSQVKGMPINILEPLSLRPYFFAPVVIAPRLLRFRLIVKDREGAESFPAYVNVTVTP